MCVSLQNLIISVDLLACMCVWAQLYLFCREEFIYLCARSWGKVCAPVWFMRLCFICMWVRACVCVCVWVCALLSIAAGNCARQTQSCVTVPQKLYTFDEKLSQRCTVWYAVVWHSPLRTYRSIFSHFLPGSPHHTHTHTRPHTPGSALPPPHYCKHTLILIKKNTNDNMYTLVSCKQTKRLKEKKTSIYNKVLKAH